MHVPKQLRIGELAEAAGVNPKTVRYYEHVGVLPAPERSAQGWRVYGGEDVHRLRFVRGARALGICLEDIREILAFRDRGEPPCLYVLELIEHKVEAVDRQIAELEKLREGLVGLHEQGRKLPVDRIEMKECVCHLIENRALRSGSASRGDSGT